MAGRVMNHVRDAVYGIVAHPTMSPAEQAEMLKRLADANSQADQISQTAVPMPAQTAPPSAAFPTAVAPPVAAFPAMPAGPSMAAAPPTAAPPGAGDEIDRQKMLALAALARPTTYPSL